MNANTLVFGRNPKLTETLSIAPNFALPITQVSPSLIKSMGSVPTMLTLGALGSVPPSPRAGLRGHRDSLLVTKDHLSKIKRDMVSELDGGQKKEEKERDNDVQAFFLSWQTLLRVSLVPSLPSGARAGRSTAT